MSLVLVPPPPQILTVADLLERLGGVAADRVRFRPLPGAAKEHDVIEIEAKEDRVCELVDGTLVEKSMGFDEAVIGAEIIRILYNFVKEHDLGRVAGADAMFALAPGLVRIPDVAFISHQRFVLAKAQLRPIPSLAPDLAIEVLSKGNTSREMQRKREEYFAAGVRLVWEVDSAARTVAVFTTADSFTLLTEDARLTSGDVLPGFSIRVAELFA